MTSEKKKKLFKRVIIVYLIFVLFIVIAFYAIRNNPIEKVAANHIALAVDTDDFVTRYGRVTSVSKNTNKTIKKSKNSRKLYYDIKTDRYDMIVCIILKKEKEEWEVISMKVAEINEH
ncbi:MAG: hypothetical protein IJN56_00045 [Clostridia bacterium]|nr:hypothetical protein [Clostridia bacterium]